MKVLGSGQEVEIQTNIQMNLEDLAHKRMKRVKDCLQGW
jgi:hypothetical protein